MVPNASAIWQKSVLPFRDLMQRTERTYVRTNERHQDSSKSSRVSYATRAVDKSKSGRLEVVA